MILPTLQNHTVLKVVLKGRKRLFVGVVGNHLVEILDDDPFIKRFIRGSGYAHQPSTESRWVGEFERMILKSFDKDALVILKRDLTIKGTSRCTIALFLNKSQIDNYVLLLDALKLAIFRWNELTNDDKVFDLKALVKLQPQEIQAILSLPKN